MEAAILMAFHFLDIVPVHRTDVVEAQGLEKHTRREYGLEAAVRAMGIFAISSPMPGMDLSQSLTSRRTLRAQPRSMLRLRKRDNAPTLWEMDEVFVVVQDHDEAPAHVARLVQPFKGQPSGEGAVSDDREHMVFLSPPDPEPSPCREPRKRMSRSVRRRNDQTGFLRFSENR